MRRVSALPARLTSPAWWCRALTRSPVPRSCLDSKDAWEEIIGRCEEIKVDAFEINFSCPHGLPERR